MERINKRYTKMTLCAFCGNEATTRNKQKIATCTRHRNEIKEALRCLCGEPVTILSGKFGSYAKCAVCGNVSLKKIMDLN